MAGEIAEAVFPDVHPKVQTMSGTLGCPPIWVLTGGILRIAHTLAVGLEIVETATRVLGAVHLATDGGE